MVIGTTRTTGPSFLACPNEETLNLMISERAYYRYLAKGSLLDDDLTDWFVAEQEILRWNVTGTPPDWDL